MFRSTGFLLLAALILSARPARAADYIPTSEYTQRTVGGFTVLLSPKLLEKNAKEVDAGLRDLEGEINRLSYFIPRDYMEFFRTIPVWVESETKGSISYYCPWKPGTNLGPNPANREINPDKGMSVTLNRSHLNRQGFGVLIHECSHGYHHQKLGYRMADIENAYKQAMERKLYDAVRDYRSSNQDAKIRAYATKSAIEYFAELSRIYFLNNYHAPRDRDELAKHDPVGFALMQQIWGPLPTIAEEGAALRKNGTDLIRRGNYQGAIDDLTRALERIPNDALVYNERAAAYTFLQKDAEAIKDYSKSIRLNDKLPTAYRGRGSAYLRQGKAADALADFNRAIQLQPDYVLAYRGRASAYRALGMPEEAAKDEKEIKRLEQTASNAP